MPTNDSIRELVMPIVDAWRCQLLVVGPTAILSTKATIDKRMAQIEEALKPADNQVEPSTPIDPCAEGIVRVVNDGPCIDGYQSTDCTCNVDMGKRRVES